MIRILALAGLATLTLSACAKSDDAASADPYSGLDTQIQAWRTHIEAAHPACAVKFENKGCESFQVTCKAAQEITPDEAARGINVQLVAAMTFVGRNADGSPDRPGSSFALFSKAGGVWSRAEAMPVNMSSCAPL